MKVTRSVLVPYDAEEMFDVVNDVSSYPSFVPGCMDATVLESTPETMRATLMIKRAGVSLTLTTIRDASTAFTTPPRDATTTTPESEATLRSIPVFL